MVDKEVDDEIEEVYLREAEAEKTWNRLHEEIPQILYHYTTAIGALGIISSGRIWATHVRYLNDSSELIYANNFIRSLLKEQHKKYNSEFMKNFLNQLEFMLSRFEQFHDVYVACFCEDDDLLSQWRGYGSSGGGYALGLQPNMIGSVSSDSLLLRRVIYDPDAEAACGGVYY